MVQIWTVKQWNKNHEYRNKLLHLKSINIDKEQRQFNGQRLLFLKDSTGPGG